MSKQPQQPQTPPPPKNGGDSKMPDLPIGAPRLPFVPGIETRFGIDKTAWKALTEAIFPNAETTDSVILALAYCKARNLDVMKRVVHIVPIWSKLLNRMVDTIWPGIAELRTTASRTRTYAGRDRTEFGPLVTQTLGKTTATFPEWARLTVYRIVAGQRCAFHGPTVYWLETYATENRNVLDPNSMWRDRPSGQIEKCAEAAALRAAFPEELGGDYIPEEIERSAAGPRTITANATVKGIDHVPQSAGDDLSAQLRAAREKRDADLVAKREKQQPPQQPPTGPMTADEMEREVFRAQLASCTTVEEVDAAFSLAEQAAHPDIAALCEARKRELSVK